MYKPPLINLTSAEGAENMNSQTGVGLDYYGLKTTSFSTSMVFRLIPILSNFAIMFNCANHECRNMYHFNIHMDFDERLRKTTAAAEAVQRQQYSSKTAAPLAVYGNNAAPLQDQDFLTATLQRIKALAKALFPAGEIDATQEKPDMLIQTANRTKELQESANQTSKMLETANHIPTRTNQSGIDNQRTLPNGTNLASVSANLVQQVQVHPESAAAITSVRASSTVTPTLHMQSPAPRFEGKLLPNNGYRTPFTVVNHMPVNNGSAHEYVPVNTSRTADYSLTIPLTTASSPGSSVSRSWLQQARDFVAVDDYEDSVDNGNNLGDDTVFAVTPKSKWTFPPTNIEKTQNSLLGFLFGTQDSARVVSYYAKDMLPLNAIKAGSDGLRILSPSLLNFDPEFQNASDSFLRNVLLSPSLFSIHNRTGSLFQLPKILQNQPHIYDAVRFVVEYLAVEQEKLLQSLGADRLLKLQQQQKPFFSQRRKTGSRDIGILNGENGNYGNIENENIGNIENVQLEWLKLKRRNMTEAERRLLIRFHDEWIRNSTLRSEWKQWNKANRQLSDRQFDALSRLNSSARAEKSFADILRDAVVIDAAPLSKQYYDTIDKLRNNNEINNNINNNNNNKNRNINKNISSTQSVGLANGSEATSVPCVAISGSSNPSVCDVHRTAESQTPPPNVQSIFTVSTIGPITQAPTLNVGSVGQRFTTVVVDQTIPSIENNAKPGEATSIGGNLETHIGTPNVESAGTEGSGAFKNHNNNEASVGEGENLEEGNREETEEGKEKEEDEEEVENRSFQPSILSPLIESPDVLNPYVLGPFILSPWLLSPEVLSPSALSPIILSPQVLSPLVLNPLALSPLILSPQVLSPFILSPMVLSPTILSPTVLSPCILSPFVLGPDILSPDAISPDILCPSILSGHVLSPGVLSESVPAETEAEQEG